MTGCELVTLAEKAAGHAFAVTGFGDDFAGCTVYCTSLGNFYVVAEDGIPPSAVVMKARLTPENTSSREALRDALIVSAIQAEPITEGRYRAWLADAEVKTPSNGSQATLQLIALLTTPSEAR